MLQILSAERHPPSLHRNQHHLLVTIREGIQGVLISLYNHSVNIGHHLIQPPRNPHAIVLYCSICIYFANLNLYETKLLSTMIMIIIVMAISCMLKFEFIILK